MDYRPVLGPLYFHLLDIKPFSVGTTTVLVIAICIFFFLSFMVSGGGVAFASLSEKDLNILKMRRQPSYRRIANLLEQPRTLQNSLLITNIFLNIGIVIIGSLLFETLLPANIEQNIYLRFIIKFAALGILIVLFAEVLPKMWAVHNKVRFAASASLVIEIFNSVFFGISNKLAKLSERIDNKLMFDDQKLSSRQLDYEIDQLPETEASQEEKQILKGITKFSGTRVKQIMRTRMDVSGIQIDLPFDQVLEKVADLHYSRLPVHKANLDEIAGMLHTKDLLAHIHDGSAYNWHELIRPAFFIHEQKPIEDLLQEFRSKRIHFAIVVDEFGGTSGIVTLEDIIEEIIGDIKDEFDNEDNPNKKLDDFNYIFEGKMMINDACKAMGIPADTFDAVRGESDSVAGLVLEIAGEFPKVDEQIISGDFIFTPLQINRNRMELIRITIQQKPQVY